MDNRRKHSRIPVRIRIKISHSSFGEKIVQTKDISEGGVFILGDPKDLPAPGTIVKGQAQDMAEEAPIIDLKIVRVGADGLGLEYVV